jgi:hypothetical protein
MRVLLVTYDLKKPSQEYSKLYEILKSLPKWWHYLESTWLILTSDSAKQLYDKLCPTLDDNDNVFLIEIIKGDYWGWLPKDAWKWIKENIN